MRVKWLYFSSAALVIVGLLAISNLKVIIQSYNLYNDSRKITHKDESKNIFAIQCDNGENILILLHHGSFGYALARKPNGEYWVHDGYKPHPVIEIWHSIINAKYSDADAFFNNDPDRVWWKYK